MNLADLHSGDLLYWRGTGFKAWLVRYWTHSDYAHVGMFWRNGDTNIVIESFPGKGVLIRPYELDPPSHAQATGIAFRPQCLDLFAGKPYSYWTAILTVFTLAGRGSKAFICSELVTRILEIHHWDWHGYQPTPEGVRLGVLTSTGNQAEVLT